MSLARLYSAIFLYSVILMTLVMSSSVRNKNALQIKAGSRNFLPALLITIIAAFFIGQRPPTYAFADTGNYAYVFRMYAEKMFNIAGDEGEWLWAKFTYYCSQTVDISTYFTFVSIGYFGFLLLACRRLMPNNVLAAVLFNFGAFSFFSYSFNGIRNGLACSIILFVLALASGDKKDKILALILGILATAIHKSVMLPFVMMIASMYFVKSFKWAYFFWIGSIAISLVAGGFVENLFTGLGFDDRLDSYISNVEEYATRGFKTGFRWDFLLYSMMPIILGYYVVIKRGIKDKTYLMLLNTYTLSNAFWVMLIRASYSNRFAYLSWFMYPMVLAYPLLKLDIWGEDQGKRMSQIMLAHVGFTWIMSLI